MKTFIDDIAAFNWCFQNASADCCVFVGTITKVKIIFEKCGTVFLPRIVNDGKKR